MNNEAQIGADALKAWEIVTTYCAWTKDYNKEDEHINSNNLKELIRLYDGTIKAALTAAHNQDGWQLIESAPRDGTCLVLWDGDLVIGKWTQIGRDHNEMGWASQHYWQSEDGEGFSTYDPTHWAFLTPPEQGAKCC